MDVTRKKTFLSAEDWQQVFEFRVKVKQRFVLTTVQYRLCKRAWEEDMQRYEALEIQVEEFVNPPPPPEPEPKKKCKRKKSK